MPRWNRFGLFALAVTLAGGVACAEYDLSDDDNDTSNPGDDTGSGTDTDPGEGDSVAPPATPSFLAVEGTLAIAAGVPVPAQSSIALEYRVDPTDGAAAPDVSDSGLDGAPTLPCTRTPAIVAFTSGASPDPAVTLGWWALTLDNTPDPTCDFALPPALHLGVGELDPQLYAAMDLAGLTTTDSALYGLYVRLGDEGAPVWVYGVVGTTAQYDGTADAVTAPPLPDGTYTLRALHLLPFAP